MLFASPREARFVEAPWRWPHFSVAELSCRCGGRYCGGAYWHDPDFLDALEALRAKVGAPLRINSGHRCDFASPQTGGIDDPRRPDVAFIRSHNPGAVRLSLSSQNRREAMHFSPVLTRTGGVGLRHAGRVNIPG